MAGFSDFYLETFLGLDLRYGIFLYIGLVYMAVTKLTLDTSLGPIFYVYWLGGLVPYSAAGTGLIYQKYFKNNGNDKAFQRGQWYLCALTTALAAAFTLYTTVS